MQALMFDRLGLPAEVIELRDVPVPSPQAGEVLVRVMLSPIIPGDALFTQGLYPEPVRPRFPGETAGNYGVGIVEKAGPGAEGLVGSFVSVTHRRMWADYAVVPAENLIVLPPNYRPDLGAEFMNLVTAWDLLETSGIEKGKWLAITGGHSTVGIILAQFARAVGANIISIVRKRRTDLDLHLLGASHVLALDETTDVLEAIRDVTDGGAHALVDCVGGKLLPDLIRSLRLGSRAVIYGGFDPDPFSLHNFDVLLNLIEIRSYAYRYFFSPPPAADEGRIRQTLALAAQNDLQIPCAGHFRLDQAAAAFANGGPETAAGRRYFSPG